MTADESRDERDDLDRIDPVTTATDAAPETVAPAGRAHWGVFAAIAIAVVVVDQVTKAWLTGKVAPGGSIAVVGDVVRFIHSRNSGALFGLFADQAVLFGLVSLAVVVLILTYHHRAGRNLYLTVALALLLGGALGNLVDRFRLGYVVDWVDVGLGTVRFWTFNLADAAVSTAIFLLILVALFPQLNPGSDRPDA
jgi:signal peptidase II